MIVNPVVYGAGEGKEPVFEQVSSSNYQESNYTMSITLSHPCKVLTGLSLCFSSVNNRETVYLYSYPSYFSEGLTGSEVKATSLNYSDITKTEVEFNVIGNTISFIASVPVHLVADSIIFGGVSNIPE